MLKRIDYLVLEGNPSSIAVKLALEGSWWSERREEGTLRLAIQVNLD